MPLASCDPHILLAVGWRPPDNVNPMLTKTSRRTLQVALLVSLSTASSLVIHSAQDSPFIGRWALTLPDGGAGWLGVTRTNGYYDASILWGGGSVVPVASVFFTDQRMYVLRLNEVKRKDATGKVVRTQQFPDLLEAEVSGSEIQLVRYVADGGRQSVAREEFSGRRIPDLPTKPDLAKVKFGEPINLLNGKDLTGWRLTSLGQKSGWRVENGLLVNDPKQEEGKPHINYGNLRTEREFEDFRLRLDLKVPKDGNSGIYLRGIYEVQVADSHGRAPDSHGMGGVYSRITPTANAARPAGEWQQYEITLVDRHVTVVLNGQTVIDNQPLLGCTGGALWSDEFRPGPIYLQGDHTGVSYRNISLVPVIKAR